MIARLFNTVGPRQTGRYGMVIPRFVAQGLAGESITVFGDGTQSRCFAHVADVVGALVALMKTPAARGQRVQYRQRRGSHDPPARRAGPAGDRLEGGGEARPVQPGIPRRLRGHGPPRARPVQDPPADRLPADPGLDQILADVLAEQTSTPSDT